MVKLKNIDVFFLVFGLILVFFAGGDANNWSRLFIALGGAVLGAVITNYKVRTLRDKAAHKGKKSA